VSQSLERALLILGQLSTGPKRLGALAETLNVHKSTVLRLIQTLEAYGYVVRKGDVPEFSLGLKVVELSTAVLEQLDLRVVAAPHLKLLGSEIGETVHLAVLDSAEVVYLDKVESIHPVRMYSRVGARAPAHCTGVGKVLLAYTDPADWPQFAFHRFTPNTITSRKGLLEAAAEIRSRGWGADEQEHEESIRCIAAPVFGATGEIVAAVSVSAPAGRLSTEVLRENVPLLLAVTGDITKGLGGRVPTSPRAACP
jgi:DNA-binding IclR family transcriptional regulator